MADRKGITNFGENPTAENYASRIARVKSSKVPLGGVAQPKMPRLDQAPADRHRGVQSSQEAAAKILTPAQQQALAEQGKFVPGVGSAYARNQPGYSPQKAEAPVEAPKAPETFANPPRAEGSGLRPETVQGLEQLAKAQKDAAEVDDDLKKDLEEIDALDDTFELDGFGNRVRTLLNNKKRKDAIEARCQPLSIDDLIIRGEVRQRVPIVPGQFEPTFRSVGGDEMLFIKRVLGTDRGSDEYMIDKLSLMQLTASLYSLNNTPFPSHLNAEKDPEEALFKAKFKIVSKLPAPALADLSVNYVWFSRRLEKLFVVDNIKDF